MWIGTKLDSSQQANALDFDRLFAADAADAFAGLGFDADIFRRDMQKFRNSDLHQRLQIGQLGPLGMDDRVEVDERPPLVEHLLIGQFQEFAGRSSAIFLVCIGKKLPNVRKIGRTQ